MDEGLQDSPPQPLTESERRVLELVDSSEPPPIPQEVPKEHLEVLEPLTAGELARCTLEPRSKAETGQNGGDMDETRPSLLDGYYEGSTDEGDEVAFLVSDRSHVIAHFKAELKGVLITSEGDDDPGDTLTFTIADVGTRKAPFSIRVRTSRSYSQSMAAFSQVVRRGGPA